MADLATSVLTALEQRRRREVALTALFESAIDLAAVRDLDETLDAIVRRTRRLLHTDVAYLSLIIDGAEDTGMRVTVGSVSPAFRRLRMHIRDSIGGLVVESGMPVSTRNYFTETRIKHKDAIDAAVAEEGLVSIVGVPLLLGNDVIGVLYAGHRTERAFNADEIAVASSLGAHAAVACENARLFERMQAALAELRAANDLISKQSDLVTTAAETHVRLTKLVLRGGDLTALAETIARALDGASLAIVDRDRATLASAGDGLILPADDALQEAIRHAQGSGRAIRHERYYVASLSTPQHDYGAVVVEHNAELDELSLRVIEHASLVMALLLMIETVVTETENRMHRDLVDDVLSTQGGGDEVLCDRARRLDVDLDQPHVVVVATSESGEDVSQIASMWASSQSRCLVGKHDGRMVFFVASEEPGLTARAVAGELGRSARQKVTAGAAGPARGPAGLRAAYQEALRSHQTLIRMDAVGTGATAAELGFAGLLLAESPDLPEYVQSTIGALLDYDARRQAQLITTLQTYLACDRNAAMAARHLYLHVNTMRQRLDRIAQLLGDDWHSPRRLLEIQVALHLRSMSEALSGA
jgi:DNA-binding PucR family transcriptional regulator